MSAEDTTIRELQTLSKRLIARRICATGAMTTRFGLEGLTIRSRIQKGISDCTILRSPRCAWT